MSLQRRPHPCTPGIGLHSCFCPLHLDGSMSHLKTAQRRARYVRAPHPSPKPSRPGSSIYRHKTLQSSVTPLFRFLLISESVSSTFQTDDERFGFKAPPPPLCPSKSPHFWPGSVSTPVSLSPIICPLFRSQSDLGKMYYFIGSCLLLVHWLPLTLRIQIHSPPPTPYFPHSITVASLLIFQRASCRYGPYSCCSLHQEALPTDEVQAHSSLSASLCSNDI